MGALYRGRTAFLAGCLVLAFLGLAALPGAAEEPPPGPMEQLAPTPEELRAAVDRLDRLLVEAKAIGEATGAVHNAWAAHRKGQRKLPVCDEPELASLVARSRLFGAAWRDKAQAARAELSRVRAMAGRASVAAPVADGLGARIVQLEARTLSQTDQLLEASGWHRAFVEPTFTECGPELVVAAGFLRSGALTLEERAAPVALVGLGGGLLCPGRRPADGSVQLVDGSVGCYGERDCDCLPGPLAPGAVLGPTPAAAAEQPRR